MGTEFDSQVYCDFNATAAKAMAGKNILLAVYNSAGDKLLTVAGQRSLTINRSADSIEVSAKDTAGGWKSYIGGMKEWSIDNDGLYVPSDEAHKALGKAFDDGDVVCIKVINAKNGENMLGGLACITSYNLEAPYDDAMTYSISLQGNGPLVDLTALEVDEQEKVIDWPEGMTKPD